MISNGYKSKVIQKLISDTKADNLSWEYCVYDDYTDEPDELRYYAAGLPNTGYQLVISPNDASYIDTDCDPIHSLDITNPDHSIIYSSLQIWADDSELIQDMLLLLDIVKEKAVTRTIDSSEHNEYVATEGISYSTSESVIHMLYNSFPCDRDTNQKDYCHEIISQLTTMTEIRELEWHESTGKGAECTEYRASLNDSVLEFSMQIIGKDKFRIQASNTKTGESTDLLIPDCNDESRAIWYGDYLFMRIREQLYDDTFTNAVLTYFSKNSSASKLPYLC